MPPFLVSSSVSPFSSCPQSFPVGVVLRAMCPRPQCLPHRCLLTVPCPVPSCPPKSDSCCLHRHLCFPLPHQPEFVSPTLLAEALSPSSHSPLHWRQEKDRQHCRAAGKMFLVLGRDAGMVCASLSGGMASLEGCRGPPGQRGVWDEASQRAVWAPQNRGE